MLRRRTRPLLVAISLCAVAVVAGCNRAGQPGPASAQPIRDEKEPGESVDYLSAVPESGSSSVEEMTGGSGGELEIEADSTASDDSKETEKSADKPDDESGQDESGEDETGDDVDIEIDP